MIRWIAPIEEHRNALCVFRSTDYSLTPVPDADNKLELGVFLNDELLSPKYVLETSTPDKIRAFFTRT